MFYHRAVDRVGNDDDEIRHHLDKLKRNGRILQIVRKALAESEQQDASIPITAFPAAIACVASAI